MSKKLITDELINERLEAKGFGEKQINDEDLARESVLKHFNVEFTDRFDIMQTFIYGKNQQQMATLCL